MGLFVQSVRVRLTISGAIGNEIRHDRGQLASQGASNFGQAIRAEQANAPGSIYDFAQLQHAGRIPIDRGDPSQL